MEYLNELYSKIAARARDNGVADQEAWDGIVDEMVEEYRTDGLIDDDEDTEALEEALRRKFDEYHEAVREEGL